MIQQINNMFFKNTSISQKILGIYILFITTSFILISGKTLYSTVTRPPYRGPNDKFGIYTLPDYLKNSSELVKKLWYTKNTLIFLIFAYPYALLALPAKILEIIRIMPRHGLEKVLLGMYILVRRVI